jgi:hypothetical protein
MFTETHSRDAVHKPVRIHADRGRLLARQDKRSEAKKTVQARQRAWLGQVLDAVQMKPSQLAVGASVSDTTLTRLLNNPDYSGTLSPETIERIKKTYKVPGPEEYDSSRRSKLIGFAEATRFDLRGEKRDLAAIVSSIINSRSNVEAWRLKTMALEEAGYLPGDIVFVMQLAAGEHATPQDAVCAVVNDRKSGSVETIWRIYDPPYLVGAAQDRTAYKPLPVDGDHVRIAGVIRESFRPQSRSETR